MAALKPWNLVADIGGTNARFAVADCASDDMTLLLGLAVSDYRYMTEALKAFLRHVAAEGGWQVCPQMACFAVASAEEGAVIRFTNSHWRLDRQAISAALGGIDVIVINDFTAVGYGIVDLTASDYLQLSGDAPLANQPIVVLGPGTGLGVCSIVPTETGYHVLESEGGHIAFAPSNVEEIAVLEYLLKRFPRVSIERLLSGPGIENIYHALSYLQTGRVKSLGAVQIAAAATQKLDPIAERALSLFCRVLGAVAGDLVLSIGARGGVYVAGGIAPKILDFLQRSEFKQAFHAKGRFRHFVAGVPLRVVLKENIGLHGAMNKLRLIT